MNLVSRLRLWCEYRLRAILTLIITLVLSIVIIGGFYFIFSPERHRDSFAFTMILLFVFILGISAHLGWELAMTNRRYTESYLAKHQDDG